MLNILSTEEKKKIIGEYRLRVGVIAVLAITLFVLVSIILLGSSYVIAVSKYNDISAQLARQQQKQNLGEASKEIDSMISDINKKINLFLTASTTDRISPPEVIAKIIALKGRAIKIQGFDYDGSVIPERLAIIGVADNRDGLAKFVDDLKKSSMFTTVDLPVSSYVKSTDIKFYIMTTRGVAGKIKK